MASIRAFTTWAESNDGCVVSYSGASPLEPEEGKEKPNSFVAGADISEFAEKAHMKSDRFYDNGVGV